jgi:glyoxylate reductase
VFPEAITFLKKQFNVDMNPEERVLSREELLERLGGASGALTQLTDNINREVLESLPSVRVISNIAVGYNNFDVAAGTRLGILMTNTPGVLTETTADFAWTLLMAAARRVVEGDAFARSGKWKAWGLQMLLGHDIFGKTIGLVRLRFRTRSAVAGDDAFAQRQDVFSDETQLHCGEYRPWARH